jgi:NarL family two-component system response regulator LiaR
MHETDKTIRVLVADDHYVTRAGIRAILEEAPGIEVVGESESSTEVQQMVAQLVPDVLLLDLVMPGLRPYEIEKWVRVNYPDTVTLVLTAHDRDYYLAKMIEAGVAGYLVKDGPPAKLVQAIRRAACGEYLIGKEQLARADHWHNEVGTRWERLTDRERQVLRLLVQGLNNAAIAEALCISVKTTECHVTKILRKLSVTSRQEAIVWANAHLPEELSGETCLL